MKKSTTTALLMAGLSVAVALAGCGRTPAAVPSLSKLPTRAPLQAALPLPGALPPLGAAPAGAPGAAGSAAVILAAVRLAQQKQQGFSGSVDTWEKGPDGAAASQTLSVWWKRPSTLKLIITKGDSSSQDCKVLWDGTDNMKVKPSYMPFSIGVSISDSRVISKNGWTIKETDVSGILNVLLDASAQVSVLGPQVIDSKTVMMLQVHSPKSPRGVTMEQIGIDETLNLPTVRMLYKGTTLSYKLVAKNFKLAVPSADLLTI